MSCDFVAEPAISVSVYPMCASFGVIGTVFTYLNLLRSEHDEDRQSQVATRSHKASCSLNPRTCLESQWPVVSSYFQSVILVLLWGTVACFSMSRLWAALGKSGLLCWAARLSRYLDLQSTHNKGRKVHYSGYFATPGTP